MPSSGVWRAIDIIASSTLFIRRTEGTCESIPAQLIINNNGSKTLPCGIRLIAGDLEGRQANVATDSFLTRSKSKSHSRRFPTIQKHLSLGQRIQ